MHERHQRFILSLHYTKAIVKNYFVIFSNKSFLKIFVDFVINLNYDYGMNARPVKIKIQRLIRRYGSYKRLAERLDVTLSYVYQLEKGKIPGRHLYKIINQVYSEKTKGR